MSDYAPEAGDLVWTDFASRRGRDQRARRPALVLSPTRLYAATGIVIVSPIVRRTRPFPTSVVLPGSLSRRGEVLTTHVRSIDTAVRPVTFAGERVPAATLGEARARVAALIGLTA